MSDTVKVKWNLSTGLAGCRVSDEVDIDKEHWDSLYDHEKDDMIKDIVFNRIAWDYAVQEDST